MLPTLEAIREPLTELRDALTRQNGLDEAIERYEKAIATLPAKFGWRMEYEIRSALGLNSRSGPRLTETKGWWLYLGRTERYDPLKVLKKHPKLAAAFLCHNDGFVREEAVRNVHNNMMSPFLLSIISARLNDWVPAVRSQALQTLVGLLDHVSHDDLCHLIPFLVI